MTVYDFISEFDENKNLQIRTPAGAVLANYDGRDNIPEELNPERVIAVHYDENGNAFVFI